MRININNYDYNRLIILVFMGSSSKYQIFKKAKEEFGLNLKSGNKKFKKHDEIKNLKNSKNNNYNTQLVTLVKLNIFKLNEFGLNSKKDGEESSIPLRGLEINLKGFLEYIINYIDNSPKTYLFENLNNGRIPFLLEIYTDLLKMYIENLIYFLKGNKILENILDDNENNDLIEFICNSYLNNKNPMLNLHRGVGEDFFIENNLSFKKNKFSFKEFIEGYLLFINSDYTKKEIQKRLKLLNINDSILENALINFLDIISDLINKYFNKEYIIFHFRDEVIKKDIFNNYNDIK